MPYYLSERVNLRFVGDPVTARLELSTGDTFTVDGGGLVPKRDGGLICEFELPGEPGDVTYRFIAEGVADVTGVLRVIDHARPGAGPPTGLVGA